MDAIAESSSSSAGVRRSATEDDKLLIVRVKRKASQSPLDGFWLEISERPLKKALLDFQSLSISESSRERELRTKRVLVKHIESSVSSDADFELLQSFLPRSSEVSGSNKAGEERRRTFKKDNIQEELRSKARENKEILVKNARFEQTWRSRKRPKADMNDKAFHEMCQFYDVVRVDGEDKIPKEENLSLEDQEILSSYLPLLREFIPGAATEVESDLKDHMSKQGAADDYVYDYYTINEDMDMWENNSSNNYPFVQVDEEDFYDGPDESEYETDDSNAENNPLNDYPDEESEEEVEDEDSNDESEEDEEEQESASNDSSEDVDAAYEDVDGFDGDDDDLDYDECDDEDWR